MNSIGCKPRLLPSIKNSFLLKEIKSLYTYSPSCPLIDRPSDLSDLIKRVFPRTHMNFADFKFLEEYKKTFRCQDAPYSETRRDIYTHLSELTSCITFIQFVSPESFRDEKARPAIPYSPSAWPASLSAKCTTPPLIPPF